MNVFVETNSTFTFESLLLPALLGVPTGLDALIFSEQDSEIGCMGSMKSVREKVLDVADQLLDTRLVSDDEDRQYDDAMAIGRKPHKSPDRRCKGDKKDRSV
ncbi:hypothetical protein N0V90_003266 [Kalmusia sp. IMI 367209]|nr:hypothetical protein N0V90_003266 [Kalmusia sp. IMI 367209]